jgi:hypothetical protein
MHVSRLAVEKDAKSEGIHGLMCPYRTAKSIFCSASIMTVVIDNRRKAAYCCTEDYDRCPLFLAKVLRGR